MKGNKRTQSEFGVDKLERELIHEILCGRFRADDLLPSRERLCEMYGLGYDAVRSAVGRLVARGMLVNVPGEGTRVVDLQSSIDLRLLLEVIDEAAAEPARRWTLLAQVCGFLRFTLGEVVERAARHRDDTQLEWLRHLVRSLADRQQIGVARSVVGDWELQVLRVYAAASGCITNTAVLNSMRAFFLGDALTDEKAPLIKVQEHWALLEAVADQNEAKAREIFEAAWWRWEEHCINELKKLGWSETPSGASPG